MTLRVWGRGRVIYDPHDIKFNDPGWYFWQGHTASVPIYLSEVALYQVYCHKLSAEVTYSLKGVWHEIFDLRFYSWISVPQAHKYSIGAVLNFFENSRKYLRINVYHRCQRHWRKAVQWCQWHRRKIYPCHGFSVITGVVDTGDKFIAGDNDTGEQLLLLTTTPAINLLPVTRTRTPWSWEAAKDRRKLKGINRRYLRPPKLATAADGVIGTAMKNCIHKHPTLLDQRPLRPPKLNNAVLFCSSLAASGASDQGVWGAFAPFHGCSNDNICGLGWLWRQEIVLQKA